MSVANLDAVAYATQTTLALDAVAPIIAVLKRRFSKLRGPRAADICYATQNRQRAVGRLTELCDLILVMGARQSSNSVRLREVAAAAGVSAYLTDNAAELRPEWFTGIETIGLTAGASVPEALVSQVLEGLRQWWPDPVIDSIGEPESVQFRLPRQLMAAPADASRATEAAALAR